MNAKAECYAERNRGERYERAYRVRAPFA